MSHDFMFFDATGIDGFPTELDTTMAAFNAHLAETEGGDPADPTQRLRELVTALGQRFGSQVDGNPWNTWPPILSGGGRLVTLNVGFGADIMTMTMDCAEFAQKHGVTLIDPQGNQPVLSTPHGNGLLDM